MVPGLVSGRTTIDGFQCHAIRHSTGGEGVGRAYAGPFPTQAKGNKKGHLAVSLRARPLASEFFLLFSQAYFRLQCQIFI